VIVRPAQHGVYLITQPDHAQLSARIIEHAVTLKAHPRREAILLAVAEHDNGWAEEDAAPIVNPATGYLADFVSAPLAVRHRVWPRAIQRLSQHAWPAALVAEHAVVVYDRFRVEDGWASFFSGMEAARDQMIRVSGLTSSELSADYVFVRLGDLISLLFCMGVSQPQHIGEWSVQLTGDHVLVSPDPFGGQSIPIEVRARAIPDRTFESDDDLRATVHAAHEVVVKGIVSG
jgi:Protein of unknown function (DUF3891)